MYQAKITQTGTETPADFKSAMLISDILGGNSHAELVDAEQSIWLIDISDANEEIIEREGYLTAEITGYTVEIDLP
jgi:hypothetical protein